MDLFRYNIINGRELQYKQLTFMSCKELSKTQVCPSNNIGIKIYMYIDKIVLPAYIFQLLNLTGIA